MYIPKNYLLDDKEEQIAFLKRHSFATIVSSQNNYPLANHLPFLVSESEDKLILSAHFAKANQQWKEIENTVVLVIFNEPHAYISPTNFDKEQNVPTWNFVAVHCYGRAKLVKDPQKIVDLLENMILNYEPSYLDQWKTLSHKYKEMMINAIVAFEIDVDDIQGKKKLSQGNNQNEQQKIIDTLSKSNVSNEKDIAEYMKQNLK